MNVAPTKPLSSMDERGLATAHITTLTTDERGLGKTSLKTDERGLGGALSMRSERTSQLVGDDDEERRRRRPG